MTEEAMRFLLPESKRSLKTLIDIFKSYGVILGIVVVAEYFNGKVPRAFEGLIAPGVPTKVTSVFAQVVEGFAAILFLLVVAQTLGFIWRPLALVPVKWWVRSTTRAHPATQPKRWKRLLVTALDAAAQSLSYAVVGGVIWLLVHLAHLGDRIDERAGQQSANASALKLDFGF